MSGLEVTDFAGGGAYLNGASYVSLEDLFVGTRESGGDYLAEGNTNYGVEFYEGSHDTLSGCVVSANNGNGVDLADTSDDTLSGDFIGTDVTAKRLADANGNTLGNAGSGVFISSGAASNTVTTTVVGNNEQGVVLDGEGTEDNTLAGDWIGTNATSSIALPNGAGVVIEDGATANTIGGTTTAARDLISGNAADGVDICGFLDNTSSIVPEGTGAVTTGNVVEGDYIGVTYTGTAALGNGASGVAIFDAATHNTVGGTVSGAGNVIAGNVQDGVYISEAATTSNLVAGNDIGTNSSNSTTLGNYQGVVIENDAYGNTVGGTTAAARNVISGNNQDGVHIVSGASDNTVEGNYIGTNVGGTAALGNGQSGVAIYGGAYNNTIGGTVSGAGNVLSGNDQNGVYISDSGTTGNLVEGNDIGTNSSSSTTLGNSQGVLIQNDASCNTIGGTIAAACNVISGNNQDGVHIVSCAYDNMVEGNYIGTNVGGTAALGNGQSGVAIYGGASNNTVGGTVSGAGNVLSGNGSHGVYISDSGTTGNLVVGDDIGTNASGTAAVPNYIGVFVGNGATCNTIGGTATAASDFISGNNWDGVQLVGGGTSGNVVEGDSIGLGADGAILGNAASGVSIYGGACNNTIGGTSYGATDAIFGNAFNGVYIGDSGTSGNMVVSVSMIDNKGNGVQISDGASCNVVDDSLAAENGNNGVQIDTGSSNNTIENSTFEANGASGVYIDGSCSYNTVAYCTLDYNVWGLFDTGTNDNDPGDTAVGNTISNYVW